MKSFGLEKRDLLQKNVTAVKTIQETVQNQFTSALDRYMAVVSVDGNSDLAKQYRKLEKQYNKCDDEVSKLENKVNDFEHLSHDLIKEWKKELKQYSDKEMRKASSKKMKETDARLDKLLASMNQSVAATKPVLKQLHDHVLFLKHNLNSQAIAGLQQESEQIKVDADKVIATMQASITESQNFIDEMGLIK
jgi:chromosome segregation ATPase